MQFQPIIARPLFFLYKNEFSLFDFQREYIMIFSFRSSTVRPQETAKAANDVDHDRLIEVSLMKLSNLQCMGRTRTERQILFVLEVLQHALFTKSLKKNGKSKKYTNSHNSSNVLFVVSVADLVYFFEQEIYSAIMRSNVDRLPRLWIDLPGGLENAKNIKSETLPFRIKASFTKKKF